MYSRPWILLSVMENRSFRLLVDFREVANRVSVVSKVRWYRWGEERRNANQVFTAAGKERVFVASSNFIFKLNFSVFIFSSPFREFRTSFVFRYLNDNLFFSLLSFSISCFYRKACIYVRIKERDLDSTRIYIPTYIGISKILFENIATIGIHICK